MTRELDAQTAERINALAKSLKDLHLVATMEEAYQRAREIILGTKKEQTADFQMEKTIGELMGAEKKEAEELKKKAGELEVYEREEEAEKKETEEELGEVERELSAEEREVEEIKEVAEKAEKVSEETSKEK